MPVASQSARTTGCSLTRTAMELCFPRTHSGTCRSGSGSRQVTGPGQCRSASARSRRGRGSSRKRDLVKGRSHQNHAFLDRALLQLQNLLHRFLVPGITTQPPDSLGGIGNNAASENRAASAVQLPVR